MGDTAATSLSSQAMQIQALLIGRPAATATADLIETILSSAQRSRIAARFSSIADALHNVARFGHINLIVVHQSCSDEFAQADIHSLIGVFPHAAVTCCYGDWCISDARTHDLWPVGCRVPVTSASVVLQALITDGLPCNSALPHPRRVAPTPLSAAEEVFQWHSTLPQLTAGSTPGVVDIHMADVEFRRTVAQICHGAGWRHEPALTVDDGPIRCRITDMDDRASTRELAVSGDIDYVIGVTGFATTAIDSHGVDVVVPKLDAALLLPEALARAGEQHARRRLSDGWPGTP